MPKRLLLVAIAVLCVSIALGCADTSGEPTPGELKRRIRELTEENAGLNDRIDGLQAEIDEFNSELSTLRAERNALKKELSVLKSRGASRGRNR